MTITALEDAGYSLDLREPARERQLGEGGEEIAPATPAFYDVVGHGLVVHISADDDEAIAALAHPDFVRDRRLRLVHPEAALALDRLEQAGWSSRFAEDAEHHVDLVPPGGKKPKRHSPDELVARALEHFGPPPPRTAGEAIARAVEALPERATAADLRAAILAAVAPFRD